MAEVYEFLEAERIKYAIRLPANQVLQRRLIAHDCQAPRELERDRSSATVF
jgi:hypothetical protein